MKILFIAPRYTGGIGGHAAMLATQLQKYGYQVDLMNIPHIPIKNLKNPSFAVFSSLKGIFSKNYDIVHAFNLPSVFAMRFSKGKKKVLSLHGVYSEQIKVLHSNGMSNFAGNVESKVLNWPDALTTDSKVTQHEYQKLGFNLEYLPSPIDISNFNQVPDVKKIPNQIAYVGRDSFEKGIDILKSAESKINGKIVYSTNLSWIEAMKNLKASEILILPSRMESSPTTVKESFYLKIPVIATDVGGVSELVKHDNTGILIPPNDPSKLVEAVNTLLQNKEKSKQLAERGYDFVIENMTWKVVLPKYVEFYEKLLKN